MPHIFRRPARRFWIIVFGGATTPRHPNFNLRLTSALLGLLRLVHEAASDQSFVTGYSHLQLPDCPIGAVTPAFSLAASNLSPDAFSRLPKEEADKGRQGQFRAEQQPTFQPGDTYHPQEIRADPTDRGPPGAS